MMLRPGQKLHSAVSDAQLVVVRAPALDVEVGCGGVPLRGDGEDGPDGDVGGRDGTPPGDGPQLGKRYGDDESGIELLCTRPGDGALTVDGRPLLIKGAKPLPSSD